MSEVKDWLYVDGRCITPNGIATVKEITEDRGVWTTRGTFCRAELEEVYKPEFGVVCECLQEGSNTWQECVIVPLDYVCIYNNSIPRTVCTRTNKFDFRGINPHKDRSKFVEVMNSRILSKGGNPLNLRNMLSDAYDCGARIDNEVEV